MSEQKNSLSLNGVAHIVELAGGRIVGRTRFQKIGYLLEALGLGSGFEFSYRHYGPYSSDLASDMKIASLIGLVKEQEQPASWGGTYSIYETTNSCLDDENPASKVAAICANANAIDLELAATAVFLAQEDFDDPWAETARRKADKVNRRGLDEAKALVIKLFGVSTPAELPPLAVPKQ